MKKWTKDGIKRALEIIDAREIFHSASSEVSQAQEDADFLSTYRRTLGFESQEDFRAYVKMNRDEEINFLFNRLQQI